MSNLKATPRTRNEKLAAGLIPAVAYNKEKNVSFAIDLKTFDRIFRSQGISGIFDIELEGESFPALVKTVQMDKRRRVPLHVDFYIVTAGQSIEASVPLRTEGRSKGEIAGGLVDLSVFNIAVVAKGPRHLPQEIVVDVTELEIGDSVTAGQIKLPANVELAVDPELNVLSVLPPRLTAEELEAETEAAQAAGAEAAAMGQEDSDDLPKEGTEGRNLDKDNHKAEEIRSESGQQNN